MTSYIRAQAHGHARELERAAARASEPARGRALVVDQSRDHLWESNRRRVEHRVVVRVLAHGDVRVHPQDVTVAADDVVDALELARRARRSKNYLQRT